MTELVAQITTGAEVPPFISILPEKKVWCVVTVRVTVQPNMELEIGSIIERLL